METKSKNDIFIEKAISIHSDRYDYSKVEYVNNYTKIIIICKIHGEFLQDPTNHFKRRGCKQCGFDSQKLTKENFIKKATIKHNNKYDYSKVEYINTKTNVIIICNEHGEFLQLPYNHLTGYGCKQCGILTTTNKQSKTQETFIKEANLKHNNKYSYNKVIYINSNKKIIIICPTHGDFTQTAGSHLSGKGCSKCGTIESYKKQSDTIESFIERSIKLHGNFYSYNKAIYINANTRLIIECPKHGDFQQVPSSHLGGSGCGKCSRNVRLTTEEFILKSRELNDNHLYDKTNYINMNTKLTLTCKIHGDYQTLPLNHLRNLGNCPKCRMCPSCLLFRTNGKLCEYCIPAENNKLYKQQYVKTKEYAVVKYLKEQLPDEEFIYNKSVGNDCTGGHLFPDILFERDYYNVIVEVDEYEHRGASYQCDEKRMYDIIAKLGLPTVFIRYNPDGKNADKEVLLNCIIFYLNLNENDNIIWNEFGLKTEYLFYKNRDNNF